MDERAYVDPREKPDLILNMTEDVLFRRLGLVAFQIENYGYYDPCLLLKADFEEKGKDLFQKYSKLVKNRLCGYYESMKESGVLGTIEAVYLFILGFLMANDVPRAIASGIAAIIAKQGMHMLCKEE